MADLEKSTRELLRVKLEADFEIYEGWKGLHKHSGESVYYDLVLFPRQHLIENNFDKGYVIVEIKIFNQTDKTKHDTKAKDMFWQCIAYSYSLISLPQGDAQPPLFVLYFIDGSGIDDRYKDKINFLHHFVQRGGVGRLAFDKLDKWKMIFGGSFYFHQRYGRGKCNVGTKRMTGSSR